jgi:hypothetical protein
MAIKLDGMKKKAKVSNINFSDEKYTGNEPQWDYDRALTFSNEEFDHYLRQSLRYYNYYYSTKDLKKYVVAWLRQHEGSEGLHKLDKLTIDRYQRSADSLTPFTVCALIKAHERGMPLRDRHVEYIIDAVKKVLTLKADDDEEEVEKKVDASKPQVKVLTIQDRMNEVAKKHILYFEILEDGLFAGETVDPKAYEYLTKNTVPQALIGKIQAVFEPRYAELQLARKGEDEQLKEGYSHYKAADFKRCEAFYDKLFQDLTTYNQTKKATKKAAVRKPPQKEKLVKGLKYLKQDAAMKIVSINPVDIIGAEQLWVYNVKTRKLGRYVAEDQGGILGVKGTTITGFSDTKSTQKTLRKPDEQVKAFLASNKVELRKFLENIKTTEIKLNGRINADTILLKII